MLSTPRHCRRGSAYVAILGAATIVTVIGLSALLAARVRTRSANWVNDIIKARTYAQAGLQWAFLHISQDPDWRTTFPNGQWVNKQGIDDGSFSVWVTDPNDGDLGDSPEDPVLVKAAGYKGGARQLIQAELVPDTQPLEALNTCLHAAGQVEIKGGKTLTAADAPVSTNANLRNDGFLVGAVEAATRTGGGVVTGTVTVPAPAKGLPYGNVFEMYRSIATAVPDPGTIDKQLLTPGNNPWGFTHPDGVYYIDTGGSDLTIKDSRIHGTLVVKCPGKKVVLDSRVLLHNYRDNYPVLIVDGNVEIRLKSATETLEEDQSRNMNPPGSPYEGHSDFDNWDQYPCEVRGLVHVKGNLELEETARVRGVILCEGAVICDDNTRIIHNPDYYKTPPMGYIEVERMRISPGSIQQVMP